MADSKMPDLSPPAEFLAGNLPSIATEGVPLCAVCGAAEHTFYARGFDYELRTCANAWTFVACSECGQVRLHPRPSVNCLPIIYPATYYAYQYARIPALARRGKELLDSLKIRSLIGLMDNLPASYLDVGCGDGRYLEALARRGVPRDQLFGLELDEGVVEKLRGRGFSAFCERVETCEQFPAASLDLISMFHVIEHVDAPDVVIERLASWLRPGGVLALETPNLESMDARLFRRGLWGGYHIPRHWHLFTASTLSRLLERFGLEVVEVSYQTGHSFWMYSFHHLLRYGRRSWPQLARFFDPLNSIAMLAAFTGFDKLRAGLGFKTSAMLILARKKPAPKMSTSTVQKS